MKMSTRTSIAALACTILLASCTSSTSDDTDATAGDGNYGVLTVSQRSGLVPSGWMPEGNHAFQVQNHYKVTSASVELGLAENSSQTTSIIVGLGKSHACVSGGTFCVVNSSTGHPAIGITIIDTGTMGMGQYRASAGTVHIENLDPLIVRFEKIYMTPEPYTGNKATGSFYLDGKLFAQQQ